MLNKLRHVLWRHERGLTVAYVAAVGLGLLALGVAPVRGAILDKAEAASSHWDARWLGRIDEGERLEREGKHREAAEYLTALDEEFPAQYVKHRFDDERKRVLRALGASQQALGDSAAALGAYRRLVAFDPRDFLSHAQLAAAATRFGGTQEAVAQWRETLAINPVYLPALRALVGALSAEARNEEVVTAVDAFADAYLLQHVKVTAGDTSVYADVPVDGLPRAVEVALPHPVLSSGSLTIDAGGFAMDVAGVAVAAPVMVGEPGRDPVTLAPGAATPTSVTLALPAPAQAGGVSRVAFRATLRRPIDAALWVLAERAYAETGASARAAMLRARLDVQRDAAAADRIKVDVSL